jgi:hypothetical protein
MLLYGMIAAATPSAILPMSLSSFCARHFGRGMNAQS